jgi:hypothetical protein
MMKVGDLIELGLSKVKNSDQPPAVGAASLIENETYSEPKK